MINEGIPTPADNFEDELQAARNEALAATSSPVKELLYEYATDEAEYEFLALESEDDLVLAGLIGQRNKLERLSNHDGFDKSMMERALKRQKHLVEARKKELQAENNHRP